MHVESRIKTSTLKSYLQCAFGFSKVTIFDLPINIVDRNASLNAMFL